MVRVSSTGGLGGGVLRKMLVITPDQLERMRGEADKQIQNEIQRQMKALLEKPAPSPSAYYSEWDEYRPLLDRYLDMKKKERSTKLSLPIFEVGGPAMGQGSGGVGGVGDVEGIGGNEPAGATVSPRGEMEPPRSARASARAPTASATAALQRDTSRATGRAATTATATASGSVSVSDSAAAPRQQSPPMPPLSPIRPAARGSALPSSALPDPAWRLGPAWHNLDPARYGYGPAAPGYGPATPGYGPATPGPAQPEPGWPGTPAPAQWSPAVHRDAAASPAWRRTSSTPIIRGVWKEEGKEEEGEEEGVGDHPWRHARTFRGVPAMIHRMDAAGSFNYDQDEIPQQQWVDKARDDMSLEDLLDVIQSRVSVDDSRGGAGGIRVFEDNDDNYDEVMESTLYDTVQHMDEPRYDVAEGGVNRDGSLPPSTTSHSSPSPPRQRALRFGRVINWTPAQLKPRPYNRKKP